MLEIKGQLLVKSFVQPCSCNKKSVFSLAEDNYCNGGTCHEQKLGCTVLCDDVNTLNYVLICIVGDHFYF